MNIIKKIILGLGLLASIGSSVGLVGILMQNFSEDETQQYLITAVATNVLLLGICIVGLFTANKTRD